MRIISLAPSNTEILYALGMGRHIVGVTHFCDYPTQAKRKAKVGTWTASNVDAITDLNPDLIFTSYYLPPELQKYTGPGELIHLEPRTLGDIFASIISIGTLVGKTKEARKLINSLEQQLYEHSSASPLRTALPRVYAEEWGHPPMASGNWVPQIMSAAGAEEVLLHPGEPSREVTAEEVDRADPDLIILNWCGAGDRAEVTSVTKRPGWGHIQAVREGRVYVIHDSLLNRPGPRLVDGVDHIRRVLRDDGARGLPNTRKPASIGH